MNFAFTDERSILWIATLLYCMAFGLVLFYLMVKGRHPRMAMLTMVAAAFALQTLGLYMRGLEVKSCPLGNVFERVQFIIWSAILLYLLVGPAFRMSLLGFFTSGLAAVLGVVSLVITPWDRVYDIAAKKIDPWVEMHAATAVFSYGIFGILALTSAMYLIQNYGLKRKRFTGVFAKLPSIVQLDQMNVRLLLTGVVVLTFSLGVGAIYWSENLDNIQGPKLIKLIFTVSLWIAYMIVFVLHKSNRLITRRFALTCIVLFVAALVSIRFIETSHASSQAQTRQAP